MFRGHPDGASATVGYIFACEPGSLLTLIPKTEIGDKPQTAQMTEAEEFNADSQEQPMGERL
jgi:hypothetical protein